MGDKSPQDELHTGADANISPSDEKNLAISKQFVITLDDPRESLQVLASGELDMLPSNNLPQVDDQTELKRLQKTIGQSGENELQRSHYYRSKPQVDYLRKYIDQLPETENLTVLNIGPAHAEEATILGVIASNSGKLGRTHVDFADLASRDMIEPEFSLGLNILSQPIEPPNLDRSGFVFIDGTWHANRDIQNFVLGELNQPSNTFGTAIENYCRNIRTERHYNIVTFNNVAQYLGRGEAIYDNPIYQDTGDFRAFQSVLLSVAERVTDGGILAMQTTGGASSKKVNTAATHQYLHDGTNFSDVFNTIDAKAGIYQRKTVVPLKFNIVNATAKA